MSQEWFNWENKTLIKDQVYVLHDFLKNNIYHELKHEIRHVPNVWHNNYTNRLIVENVRSPRIIEFASRLLPYLAELFGGEYSVTTAKIYLDLSGSSMFPHFDHKNFHISMQVYMPDIDLPELGTQFCFNHDINQQIENDPDILTTRKRSVVPESEYESPVPFRKNYGYINFNHKPVRTLHKTKIVPPGSVRESLHFNFNIKQNEDLLGLENIHYQNLISKEQL
jgi:hypothetical protein